MKKIVWLLSLLYCLSAIAYADTQIPEPTKRPVSDFAGLLTSGEQEMIAGKIRQFYDSTSIQIAVITVPVAWRGKLPIEEYANQLANVWQLGSKANNGLLFLIVGSPTDTKGRGVRFEVGYGLEGALPDARCKQIQTSVVVPALKSGNYFMAIDEGSNAIIRAIQSDLFPVGEITEAESTDEVTLGEIVIVLLLAIAILVGFIIFVVFIFFLYRAVFRPQVLNKQAESVGGTTEAGTKPSFINTNYADQLFTTFSSAAILSGNFWPTDDSSSTSDSSFDSQSSSSLDSSSDYSGDGGSFGGGGSSSEW